MDTKKLDEQNLPEKGAENVEVNSTEKEQTQQSNNEVENTQETPEKETVNNNEADDAQNTDLAETKEDNKETTEVTLPEVDYSTLSKKDLLAQINELTRHFEVDVIKNAVEEIKIHFYKQHKQEKDEAKSKFEEEGGNPDDFKFTDPDEDAFKVIYNLFKQKKHEANLRLDEIKKANLEKKYQIIDEIKELINNEESINKTFNDFKALQQRWYNVGLVPQNELKNLWESYHHAVESFYDFVKINKELRDLDLKTNLNEKTKLCEKAEALALVEPVTTAFKQLQEYHNMWREIGPVPRELREEIWNRFKTATTLINKKHQQFFDDLKEQQIKNLEEKTKLCEKVEEILTHTIETAKEWEAKSEEIINIQQLWKETGFARKKDNNKIYNRFKTACDEFFLKKREFYKAAKEVQKENLKLKMELCEKAEEKQESTDWKETTNFYIQLQKDWKKIGPIPKKYSENLWNRFRTACDTFFNAKKEFFAESDERQEDNLKLKMELIEKIKNFESSDNKQENLNKLMDFQKQWSEIGYVPLNKKEEVNKEFYSAIDSQFEKLKIEQKERNLLNFQNKVENWTSSQSKGKIYSERNKLINQIRELENEIALYENNIGFFSQSSNTDAMVNNIKKKIEKSRERIDMLKSKLRMLEKTDL